LRKTFAEKYIFICFALTLSETHKLAEALKTVPNIKNILGTCLFLTTLLISDTSLFSDACGCRLPYFLQRKSAEVSTVTNVLVPILIQLEGFYGHNNPFCTLSFQPEPFALPDKGSLLHIMLMEH